MKKQIVIDQINEIIYNLHNQVKSEMMSKYVYSNMNNMSALANINDAEIGTLYNKDEYGYIIDDHICTINTAIRDLQIIIEKLESK